jgi:hypothetical protein
VQSGEEPVDDAFRGHFQTAQPCHLAWREEIGPGNPGNCGSTLRR